MSRRKKPISNRLVPEFYKRTEKSPWMAIPKGGIRPLLTFGTYFAIRYSDGSIAVKS